MQRPRSLSSNVPDHVNAALDRLLTAHQALIDLYPLSRESTVDQTDWRVALIEEHGAHIDFLDSLQLSAEAWVQRSSCNAKAPQPGLMPAQTEPSIRFSIGTAYVEEKYSSVARRAPSNIP